MLCFDILAYIAQNWWFQKNADKSILNVMKSSYKAAVKIVKSKWNGQGLTTVSNLIKNGF